MFGYKGGCKGRAPFWSMFIITQSLQYYNYSKDNLRNSLESIFAFSFHRKLRKTNLAVCIVSIQVKLG